METVVKEPRDVPVCIVGEGILIMILLPYQMSLKNTAIYRIELDDTFVYSFYVNIIHIMVFIYTVTFSLPPYWLE